MSAITTLFRRRSSSEVNMTEGSILRHLLVFAFPLLIGNIFQQLYNLVDTWVVGNYVSNEAFAAVGSVSSVINVLIGFFSGLSTGAGAVISQYFGAKDEERVKRAVHTSLLMTFLLGILFTAVGILITPLMLRLMNTPDNVIGQSTAYLTIYFAGILGLMVYNIGAGILRAVGDSRHPFYFLAVSAAINIVLDLVFVLVFDMGVKGVALATVVAQGVSALLVIITLIRTDACVRLSLRDLRIDLPILSKIATVGFPAGIQISITAFSNVFVQSYINDFGADGMSAWTAYTKIDQLLLLPMQSIALSSTTFVAQNLGSRQTERAKAGVRTALWIGVLSTAVLIIPVLILAPSLVSFFNGKAEVIEIGALFLRFTTPFYILCCYNQIYASALRGSGNTRAPMIILLSSFVVFRQIALFLVSTYLIPYLATVTSLTEHARMVITAMAYPAGWLLATALLTIYYHKVGFSKGRIIEKEAKT
ncbi:MAG: MATE family efflux transporter [Ruminococcaceae bacterium]|nr:MATE family efflux transporter [Oscillospiraceae bacterium]